MIAGGNLFADLPDARTAERFTPLASSPGARIERIVSHSQASPEGFWYDQPGREWVVLLSGEAAVTLEGEAAPRTLRPGDWLDIPPRQRHRVERTASDVPTVWLAVHFP